jgi:hypothetical protein
MNALPTTVVVRVTTDCYRLDHKEPNASRAVAFVVRTSGRLGNSIGWRLKPLVCMQGSKSRVWSNPVDAIASTRLFTVKEAERAVAAANSLAASMTRAEDNAQFGHPPTTRSDADNGADGATPPQQRGRP